jgi:hypothetical protein
MMPTRPMAAFKVIRAEFIFQFRVIDFKSPSSTTYLEGASHSRRARSQLGQPILQRLCFIREPINKQPLRYSLIRVLGLPPVGCPRFDLGVARALGSLGALPPSYVLPHGGWKMLRHREQILCGGKAPQWRTLSETPHSLWRRQGHIRISSPKYSTGLNGNSIRKKPFSELLSEPKVISIESVGCHRQRGQLPAQHLVNQLQSQVGLSFVLKSWGQFDAKGPLCVFYPLLWPKESASQGTTTGFIIAPVQAHRNLAISYFPQSPTILSRHPHRMLPCFGKRGVIDDPDFRLAEQIDYFQSQASLDFLHSPRALPNELPQSLNVRTRHAAGNRFNGFAFPVEQQPLQVNPGPVAPLASPPRRKQIHEKLCHSLIKRLKPLRVHANSTALPQEDVNNHLTQYF